MGSFNVACSISNLSIGPGDPIAFFPLVPNTYPRNSRVHELAPQSNLIYSNCLFNPLCLPIFGEYDDYGGVGSIEENANTKALEQFFQIPISEIESFRLRCLTSP